MWFLKALVTVMRKIKLEKENVNLGNKCETNFSKSVSVENVQRKLNTGPNIRILLT